MRRDVKAEGGLIAHVAWWLRVGLIDMSVVVCKAVVWLSPTMRGLSVDLSMSTPLTVYSLPGSRFS